MKRFCQYSLLVNLCFWLALPAFVLAQEYRIETKTFKDLQSLMQYSPDFVQLASAHRGLSCDSLPENSLEAFQHTVSQGWALVEFDIALTADGVPVLMHDRTLERTTTGTGEISSYTYAQLQTLQLKNKRGEVTPYKIPTLAQALDWARGRTVVCLDMKGDMPPAKIVEEVRKAKAESYAIIITYDLATLESYHRLHPKLFYSVSLHEPHDLERLRDKGIPFNQVYVFAGVGRFNAELVKLLHQNNISVMLGTFRNIDHQAVTDNGKTYTQLAAQGIDLFATDQAPLVHKTLEGNHRQETKRAKFLKFYPKKASTEERVSSSGR